MSSILPVYPHGDYKANVHHGSYAIFNSDLSWMDQPQERFASGSRQGLGGLCLHGLKVTKLQPLVVKEEPVIISQSKK